MRKIEPMTNPNGKRQAAFIAMTAEEKLYKNYDGVPEEARETIIPVAFMLNRWDGMIGFPGGQVEEGEDLREAAARELLEETGLSVVPSELAHVVSHEFSIVTHLFALKRSYAELLEVQKRAIEAEHYGAETAGTALMHLMDYGKGKGLRALIASSLAKSVREELAHLLLSQGVISEAELAKVCEEAGHSLKELLA